MYHIVINHNMIYQYISIPISILVINLFLFYISKNGKVTTKFIPIALTH